MEIDLRQVPFSSNGAYLAFSLLEEGGGRPAGLYLRSVHGGAQAVQPGGRLALVEVTLEGRPLPYQVQATPARLDLRTVRGTLSLCMAEPDVVRVRGEGVGLRLTFDARLGDYAIPAADGRCRINCPAFQTQFMLAPLTGSWVVDAPWTGAGATQVLAELRPEQPGVLCEGLIAEYASVWRPREVEGSFEEAAAGVAADYRLWQEQAPALPGVYAATGRLAAYVLWSSMVEPVGHFLRPSIYRSKNQMTNVWGWDHCFNAMALCYHKPVTAWDQMMTLFDQQDEHGGLPDNVNDRALEWNFCKPPIHGWAVAWMMQRTAAIRADQIRQIYGPLCRWTEWWLRYRDDDRDGLPQYHHGNDSGWEHSSVFDLGVPLETPDLCAFLILQMETLANLAGRLNSPEEAESWQRRADELLEKMLAHFWQGDHFVALRSGDHLVADTESLLLSAPLILGRRLPGAVRRELIDHLTRAGRFLTPYGLATESPKSHAYQPDGPWRGPIWAPGTLILVEGLAACGELELARDIARRFCDLVDQAGFSEHFDALTGAGLGESASTWTASVFLILAHEFLMD